MSRRPLGHCSSDWQHVSGVLYLGCEEIVGGGSGGVSFFSCST